MNTIEKLKQVQQVLEIYQRADDGAANMLKGFSAKKGDISANSPARAALSLISSIIEEAEEMQSAKDMAYWERNRLVAIISRIYPSGRAVTNIPGWDDKWHNCIYIDTPRGQLSWHVHDNEMVQFASLPEYPGTWDGHDTDEKYRRLLLLLLHLENKNATNPTEDA